MGVCMGTGGNNSVIFIADIFSFEISFVHSIMKL